LISTAAVHAVVAQCELSAAVGTGTAAGQHVSEACRQWHCGARHAGCSRPKAAEGSTWGLGVGA
jgi:hypothetical protein